MNNNGRLPVLYYPERVVSRCSVRYCTVKGTVGKGTYSYSTGTGPIRQNTLSDKFEKKIVRVRFLMFADKREELGGSSGGARGELNWKIGELGGSSPK